VVQREVKVTQESQPMVTFLPRIVLSGGNSTAIGSTSDPLPYVRGQGVTRSESSSALKLIDFGNSFIAATVKMAQQKHTILSNERFLSQRIKTLESSESSTRYRTFGLGYEAKRSCRME